MDRVMLLKSDASQEQADQSAPAATLDSGTTSSTDTENDNASTTTVTGSAAPKNKAGRPKGVKKTAPRKRKRASSTGMTVTTRASKRPKRGATKSQKKADADAQAAYENEFDPPESDSSEDTIEEVRHQVQAIESESKYKRTYRGAALAPDRVLDADEQLNAKLEAALWSHCADGQDFGPIPVELSAEWAALVASMLDRTTFEDIKPSVLNHVWRLLNLHLEDDANASSGAAAQFMVTMIIVNGQGFQDVNSLNRFYNPVVPLNHGKEDR